MTKERKEILKLAKKEMKSFHKLSLAEKEERYRCVAYAFLYQAVKDAHTTCRKRMK